MESETIELHDNVLVRRLVLQETTDKIAFALGVDSRGEDAEFEFRAKVFILALGRGWCPPLLLLSACPRFPEGLANSSGLVGKYIVSQQRIYADIHVPDLETYPGMNYETELQTRKFFRCPPDAEYLRYMVLLKSRMRSSIPELMSDEGRILLGDELMDRWREDNAGTLVRVVALRDVHPSRDSETVLEPSRRNRWGDPLPKLTMRIDEPSRAGWGTIKQRFAGLFDDFVKSGGGEVSRTNLDDPILLTHEAGGCRMGGRPRSERLRQLRTDA